MDEGENAVFMAATSDYAGYMLFFFENGKAAKVELASYQTKTNRKKLLGAYASASPLVSAFQITGDAEFILTATSGRMLIVHTGAINVKTTRSTQGVAVMTLKKNHFVSSVRPFGDELIANAHRFRTKTLPAAGMIPRSEDQGEQLTL